MYVLFPDWKYGGQECVSVGLGVGFGGKTMKITFSFDYRVQYKKTAHGSLDPINTNRHLHLTIKEA
jgi:hypothetical protein